MKVRDISIDDTAQVAAIATKTLGFSVPTPYEIWMLARTQGKLCLVCTNENGRVYGYALGLVTYDKSEIFIWQLGIDSSISTQRAALVAVVLCKKLAERSVCDGIKRVRFTAREENVPMLKKLIADALGTDVIRASSAGFPGCPEAGKQSGAEAEYTVDLPQRSNS